MSTQTFLKHNHRQKWTAYNISTRPVSIGDLPKIPHIPSGGKVDLLQYYTPQQLNMSSGLKYCKDKGLIKVQQQSDIAVVQVAPVVQKIYYQGSDQKQIVISSRPTGPAGGDLEGQYPNPSLKCNSGALNGKMDKTYTAKAGNLAVYNDNGQVVDGGEVPKIPSIPVTLPPSGQAGGDLMGAYPNPKINPSSISGKMDKVISASSGNIAKFGQDGQVVDGGLPQPYPSVPNGQLLYGNGISVISGEGIKTNGSDLSLQNENGKVHISPSDGSVILTASNKSKSGIYIGDCLVTIPTGGSAGQTLQKADEKDHNVKWGAEKATSEDLRNEISERIKSDASLQNQIDSIPQQKNSDWNASSGVANILNKPTTLNGYGIIDAATLSSVLLKADKSITITGTGSLTGGGDLSSSREIDIKNTSVVAGQYGSSTKIPNFSVNQKGQLVSAKDTEICPDFSNILNKPTTLNGYGISDSISNSLGSGNIIIGNKSNIACQASMSGDATIDSSGVLTLKEVSVSGVYGSSTSVPILKLDSKGRIVSVSIGNIANNYWKIGGNSGTLSSSNFIGTTDNQDFVIKTNSQQVIRVTSNSLNNQLLFSHILNNGSSGSSVIGLQGATNGRLRITSGSSDTRDDSQGASIDLNGNTSIQGGRLDLVGGSAASGVKSSIAMWTNNGDTQQVSVSILGNGNVGFGPNNFAPSNTLHVNSSFIKDTGGLRLPITSSSSPTSSSAYLAVNENGDVVVGAKIIKQNQPFKTSVTQNSISITITHSLNLINAKDIIVQVIDIVNNVKVQPKIGNYTSNSFDITFEQVTGNEFRILAISI